MHYLQCQFQCTAKYTYTFPHVYTYIYMHKCIYIYIFSIHIHMCVLSRFSCVQLFVTLWTIVCQASLSRGFSEQEHWSGLSCPPQSDHPDPEMEPTSPRSPALVGRFLTASTTWEAPYMYIYPLLFRFFSHIGLYRVLSRVSCAIQQVLISYLFYMQQCVYISTPFSQFIPPPPYPLVAVSLLFISVTLEIVLLSEVSQTKKHKYHMISLICEFFLKGYK